MSIGKSVAISKAYADNRNLLLYPDGELKPSRQIIATSALFTTAPTNLANATDGTISTVTGEGSRGIAGDFGQINIDLEAIHTCIVSGRVGVRSDTGTVTVGISSREDNTDWINNSTTDTRTTTTEQLLQLTPKQITGRYIRIRFINSADTTGYAKIYNITAHKV